MASVADRRLYAQRLCGEPFGSALDAVASLLAVQSQDYAGAKWGVGQRTRDVTDADLDRLFDEGSILRTHVMRPTWHFVLPDDVRWLLALTAPRVKAKMAPYDRRLEIDAALLGRSHAAIEAALRGGASMTRAELAAVLEGAGMASDGQRLGHLLMHAELDALVVSGPRRGRQQTYALLEERAPSARSLDREEALAELTRRYFTGHGPAQVQDCVWWSGLTVADVKRGLALVGPDLVCEVIGGKSYWGPPAAPAAPAAGPIVHLLPNYDEFVVAYRDRSDTAHFPNVSMLTHVVVLRGQVWGCWKRRVNDREVVVELGPLDVMNRAEGAALHQAAKRFASFLGLPLTITGQ